LLQAWFADKNRHAAFISEIPSPPTGVGLIFRKSSSVITRSIWILNEAKSLPADQKRLNALQRKTE
jgi:hypothetical protein